MFIRNGNLKESILIALDGAWRDSNNVYRFHNDILTINGEKVPFELIFSDGIVIATIKDHKYKIWLMDDKYNRKLEFHSTTNRFNKIILNKD